MDKTAIEREVMGKLSWRHRISAAHQCRGESSTCPVIAVRCYLQADELVVACAVVNLEHGKSATSDELCQLGRIRGLYPLIGWKIRRVAGDGDEVSIGSGIDSFIFYLKCGIAWSAGIYSSGMDDNSVSKSGRIDGHLQIRSIDDGVPTRIDDECLSCRRSSGYLRRGYGITRGIDRSYLIEVLGPI